MSIPSKPVGELEQNSKWDRQATSKSMLRLTVIEDVKIYSKI